MKLFLMSLLAVLTGFFYTLQAQAALTIPTLPITDVETAGGAVIALIASVVLIGACIKMFRRV